MSFQWRIFLCGTSTHIAKSITVQTDMDAVFFFFFWGLNRWKSLGLQKFSQLFTTIVTLQSMIDEEKIVGPSINDD